MLQPTWDHQTIVQQLAFTAAHGTQKDTWGLASLWGLLVLKQHDYSRQLPHSTHSGFYRNHTTSFNHRRHHHCDGDIYQIKGSPVDLQMFGSTLCMVLEYIGAAVSRAHG